MYRDNFDLDSTHQAGQVASKERNTGEHRELQANSGQQGLETPPHLVNDIDFSIESFLTMKNNMFLGYESSNDKLFVFPVAPHCYWVE